MATRMIPGEAHPYMAISPPGVVAEMLDAIGLDEIGELFEQIPESHRLSRPIELPPAIRAEAQLRRHVTEILSRNATCAENLSFLGAGCWQHYVPAVCDEIVSRSEFLTPVWGTPAYDRPSNTLFVGTGQHYGPPTTTNSDALMALDASTGAIKWVSQMTPNDTWNITFGVPDDNDLDFGDSPQLYRLNGRLVVTAGQKSGVFHVVDAVTGASITPCRVCSCIVARR